MNKTQTVIVVLAAVMYGAMLGYTVGRGHGAAARATEVKLTPFSPGPQEGPFSLAVLHAASFPVRFRADGHVWRLEWYHVNCSEGRRTVHGSAYVVHDSECPCGKAKR